ncbi:30980_t:CDS:2 [Gigaspora margarita]|uniref:30980_t:CDS:1 n=1 Tax=Gigaspora margarita TaxID=4874 RepID=A0ABN7WBK9_GIGMA|nr:30980_t:CDS:2 [Gigaspora margarita]
MTTSSRAKTSTSIAQRNVPRLDDYKDLINFEPREYDNEYTSLQYQEDTGRPFTLISVWYKYYISNEKEKDECIIVADPDDVQRSYLHHKSPTNEEIGKLKKVITEMAQNMKTLIQNQDEKKKAVTSPTSQNTSITTHPFQSKATSHEGESAKKTKLVDPSSRIINQPLPDNLLPPLVLNSLESLDIFQPLIEVTYCKATVEQCSIYLILDTGSCKSLVSYDFLKKIKKNINKQSLQNLIDVHGQRRHPLGVVKNFLIKVNKIEIPINIEVTEAWEYTVIVGTDWLAKVKEKIDLKYRCFKDMDESPIIEIRNDYISIKGKDRPNDRYKQVKEEIKVGNKNQGNVSPKLRCYYKKLIEEKKDDCVEDKEIILKIETLECLVDNLEEELGILIALDGFNKLETERRTQVEDLIKANEEIFAEGLIQLGQTKEEMHKIILKEETEPIKQRPC